MVVDAIIRHWVMVVEVIEAGTEGLGLLIRDLEAYLYADNGIIVSSQLERMHKELDFLTHFFI